MPAYIADLHNHTPITPSDYRGAPTTTADEIVVRALEMGIDVYAVTDHFSWGFVPRLIESARRLEAKTGRKLLVVPGVELRITSGVDEVHIVALFDQESYQAAFESLFSVLEISHDFLNPDELPRLAIERDPVTVCRAIHVLGGLCTIAHADRAFGDYRLVDSPLLEQLAAEPSVVAVDVLDRHDLPPFVAHGNVSVIGCSDSHSLEEMGRRHALLAMPTLDFAGLRRSLVRGAAVHVVAA